MGSVGYLLVCSLSHCLPSLVLLCIKGNYISQVYLPTDFWVGSANGRHQRKTRRGRRGETRKFPFCSALGCAFFTSCVSSWLWLPLDSPSLHGPTPPGILHCGSGSCWMDPALDSNSNISCHCFFSHRNGNAFLLLLCSGCLMVPWVLFQLSYHLCNKFLTLNSLCLEYLE